MTAAAAAPPESAYKRVPPRHISYQSYSLSFQLSSVVEPWLRARAGSSVKVATIFFFFFFLYTREQSTVVYDDETHRINDKEHPMYAWLLLRRLFLMEITRLMAGGKIVKFDVQCARWDMRMRLLT